MGLFEDLTTSSAQIQPTKGRSGLDRSNAEQLLGQDTVTDGIDVGGSSYAAVSEVTRIAQHVPTVSGGTYTLSVNFPTLGISYTTATIAYNATATTIETALDTASPAAIGDGDIAVTQENAAGLSDGYCDFTCANTAANVPCLITIDGASLTGGGTAGAVTRSTPGQVARRAAKALFDMNVVNGTLHNSGEAPTDWVKPASNGQSRPRTALIKALARQTIVEDGTQDAYDAVIALYPEAGK